MKPYDKSGQGVRKRTPLIAKMQIINENCFGTTFDYQILKIEKQEFVSLNND